MGTGCTCCARAGPWRYSFACVFRDFAWRFGVLASFRFCFATERCHRNFARLPLRCSRALLLYEYFESLSFRTLSFRTLSSLRMLFFAVFACSWFSRANVSGSLVRSKGDARVPSPKMPGFGASCFSTTSMREGNVDVGCCCGVAVAAFAALSVAGFAVCFFGFVVNAVGAS